MEKKEFTETVLKDVVIKTDPSVALGLEVTMKSEWRVTSQYLGDTKKYAVYRLIDVNRPDHSGNREFATGYIPNREEAAAIAERKNKEAGS